MLLVIRPNWDRTTKYISAWAESLIDWVKNQKGKSVFDLFGERANKNEFESMVKKHKPSLIFLNGHGSPTKITGQDSEVLIEIDVNEKILEDSVVYALSCSSSKELGPSAVSKGSKAYIGYKEDFIFMYEDDHRTRPLEDKTAELFLKPSNQVVMSLIKGHSVYESVVSAKKMFVKNVQSLLTSQSPQADTSAARYLLWDMQHLTFHGNKDVKVVS